MKHLTFRDVASILLGTVGILAILFVIAFMESQPMNIVLWVGFGLSIVLWLIYIYATVLERKRSAKAPALKIYRNGKWTDVSRLEIVEQPRRPIRLFDQNDYKEQA